ncbi:TetR/AcrR family transcriptional regulator [Leptospira sp. 2 VSF19]|uniref:TetR/AcrR family transcriptional regulator n=1 Tax=Leptospira soteropolitanensis TaxID=2950025 RepID=A0AAW5VLK3_9LEPT|nr:TetR/AcrR family transcriptional regulator [Leptospira soteropolitanensis]MCW7492497.1 TetR/AcrR family transcriptional regulator [Leptospira soteropolitanensis]MCW7500546.1 TetR/AcrR family transcriptional regulator [Leptospira soteropolitanensis]MCW7522784.1 TetR/AcrR family transcriptional regulator [Leptospira soteropolitanensis]MCW7526641.1 TetR/AcrR family transcriptional regulator [Leptospira soteropolitanensis]MCW7530516.1 TetR/AcrR family transcriptional regulator [Leptospira soter
MKRSSYHHGDLKNSIIKTCHKLLQKKGSTDFSLREVANLSGVSHAAVYRHFQDKEEVLEILSSIGFERLGLLQKKIPQNKANPDDYFVKLGLVYVQFAIKNPNYYKLMFLTKRSNETSILKRSKLKSYAILVRGCRFYLKSKRRKENHRSFALMAWSLVHGYSNLCLETEFPDKESKALKKSKLEMAEDILRFAL